MLPQQKVLAGTETGSGARRISNQATSNQDSIHKPMPTRAVAFAVRQVGRAQPAARGSIALRLHYATRISAGQTDARGFTDAALDKRTLALARSERSKNPTRPDAIDLGRPSLV